MVQNREQWFISNISRMPISMGIINMPVLRPGSIADILLYENMEYVEQSTDIQNYLDLGLVTIDQYRDGNLISHITTSAELGQIGQVQPPQSFQNIVDSTESKAVSMENFSIDLTGGNLMVGQGGGFFLNGGDINMGMGAGEQGGDLNMDSGYIHDVKTINGDEIRTNSIYDATGQSGFNFMVNAIVPNADIDMSDQNLLVGDLGEVNLIGSNTDGVIEFTSCTITSSTTYLGRDTLQINAKLIDFCNGQVMNTCFVNLAKPPKNPQPGQIYFDTVLNKMRCWDGMQWQNFW